MLLDDKIQMKEGDRSPADHMCISSSQRGCPLRDSAQWGLVVKGEITTKMSGNQMLTEQNSRITTANSPPSEGRAIEHQQLLVLLGL